MPVVLIVLLSILLLAVLLLICSIRITVSFENKVTLRVSFFLFSVRILPKKKKKIKLRRYTVKNIARQKRRARKKQAKLYAKRAKHEASHGKGKKKEKPRLRESIALLRALVSALAKRTGKHLHLHTARVNIRVATGDAATTAILYGAAAAALSYLLTALDGVTRLHAGEEKISLTADYLGEKSSADVKIVFKLRLVFALTLLFSLALTYLKTKRAQKLARAAKTKANGAVAPTK